MGFAGYTIFLPTSPPRQVNPTTPPNIAKPHTVTPKSPLTTTSIASSRELIGHETQTLRRLTFAYMLIKEMSNFFSFLCIFN